MHDLRAFLQHLSRHRQLLEIDAPVDPELARCQGLGEAAGRDSGCKAAWAGARARFFGGAAS